MLQEPEAVIQGLKQETRPVIGCFPLYPPMELFSAFDCLPVTLWNLSHLINTRSRSDLCVQNFACSVVRNLAEFVLSDYGDILSGIFSYNACDSLRNMPEILLERRNISDFHLHIPQNIHCSDSTAYIKDGIQKIVRELESRFSRDFDFEKFCSCVELYREMKDLSLEAENRIARGELSCVDYMDLQKLNNFCSIEQKVSNLREFISAHSGENENNATDAIGIVLSGILPPPRKIMDYLQEAGLRVVANDIAFLHRSYGYIPQDFDTVEDYYADLYQNHVPCPTLLYTSDRRERHLFDLIENTGAQGIVFLGEKFCEYEYFEFPYLQKSLDQNGINSLLLEFSVEDTENMEAYRTRIEAFAEMF